MEIEVIVEIPRGSRNKYEYDDERHALRLDRVLYSSIHYPTDYGLLPGTMAPDGDHLDVLVLCEEPTFPGCIVPARAIGVLRMFDEKGRDDKVLAVPIGDPRFSQVYDVADISPQWLLEIENFFETYKFLEHKETNLSGWGNAAEARDLISECFRAAQESPAAE
jgi:inorganic pyrophosphatase